jgi:polyisoprenoid-binding protein YceI
LHARLGADADVPMPAKLDARARRRGFRRLVALLSIVTAPALGPPPASDAPPKPKRWIVQPVASRVVLTFERAGLLAPFMRDRRLAVLRWSAAFDFDGDDPDSLTLRATFDASSLRDDEVDRADARAIERHAMGPTGLDAAKHPEIALVADRLVVDGESGSTLHGWLEGTLEVRGRSHPVRIAVGARWDDDWLHAMGRASFRQSDFGIEPFSTALGLAAIDDRVVVEFDAYAIPAEASD